MWPPKESSALTPTIALMVLASAALHPIWNTLLKGDRDRAASWWLITVMLAAFGGLHSLAVGADFSALLAVWPYLLISWCGQLLYGLCLIRIYDRGDLSAYYPIVRASPIGVVVIGFAFLARSYDTMVLAGIALTVGGAFWLQKKPGLKLLDDPVTLMLAVVSMTGTAIYALADARAVQHVSPSLMFFAVETGLTLIYPPVMALLGHGFVPGRGLRLLATRPVRHLGAILICYTSYILILMAYGQGGEVASVTTIRQASIPISVLIGAFLLKEQHVARRLPASLLMVAGILIVIHAG